MADCSVWLVGNVSRDPVLRFSQAGSAVCSFGVAVSQKRGEVESTSFFDVVAFGGLAEHVAESVVKGCRVLVGGRLEQSTWETDGGEKRSKVEVVADEVGPSLRWATADVRKAERVDQQHGDRRPQGQGRPPQQQQRQGQRPQRSVPAGEEPF